MLLPSTRNYSLSHECPSPVDEGEVEAGDDGIKIGRDEVAWHILQVAKHLLQSTENNYMPTEDAYLKTDKCIGRLAVNYMFL